MRYQFQDGSILDYAQAFKLDGISYPPNWLHLATPSELAERGITVLEDLPIIPQIQAVSPRQIRQALTRVGLRDAVELAISNGDQDLKDWWEFATDFKRTHPMVITMGTSLNVTSKQLDDLWELASSL